MGVGLCCAFLVCLLCFGLAGENSCIQLPFHFFCGFPVVDRPCPVLARQCRKKKSDLEDLSNNCSATIGAQLAGNHIQSVNQAARSKPLSKPSPIFGVWCSIMVFPLSSLLLVFLTDNLNQASATTSSLRCCTWSVAGGTVEQFPVQWQYPEPRC